MARLTFRLFGEPVAVEVELPVGEVRADELLPFVFAVTEAVVARCVERGAVSPEGSPRPVSCRKGCAACCRQPVPATLPEAEHLRRLVDRQPEPRRAELRAALAAAQQRVEAAGLGPRLRQDVESTPEAARDAVQQYLRLGLACPFLVDEACSIYPDRPLACRLHAVTTPREWCADPLDPRIVVLSIPLRPMTALMAAVEELGGPPQRTVPVALAPAFATAHGGAMARRYAAAELANAWLRHLGRRSTTN